ncbi:hypothetical protein N7414_23075 [Pseudomonas sp. GD04087]|uniref:hypothetical protein n=1 Tax=unclassified Pseudomonas TaxID=196821 RepID=UPI0024475D51|nr:MULTISPECIES: hypothetical protein [unclassified Pseudomonas]MDH0292017.1 hypothetical protein [Pseudomonas sp. GD04087]MDH1052865.1 hypothetical protein [Pseudomonas sp. GD03903]MDH2002028.1 hypothetical protein [Pseudomonas sp. GD03691]
MAFRADEAARQAYEEVAKYLLPRSRDADISEWERSKEELERIADELGPVVSAYPSWHPLVSNHDERNPETYPSIQCGYNGLDHTRCFANGFITCPYHDGQSIIDSVEALPYHPAATITAERLNVQFYNSDANPILVKCTWDEPLPLDGMIPLRIAMPLILEKEVPGWRWAQVAETWKTMQPYLLGVPHGSRSSLFVNQETGLAIKKLWETLINSGMFGNIRVRG